MTWTLIRCLAWTATAFAMVVAGTTWLSGQTPHLSPVRLDEHPSIEYAVRPTTDHVAKLNQSLSDGTRALQRDARTGYLLPVLDAFGVSVESQLLVFSKTGIQRTYTSPHTPRALYFNDSLVVGYIPGAPDLEVAAHDPAQGVVFYTLDQSTATPRFTRRTNCLTCHVSPATLDVPGMIARSNTVATDGTPLPGEGSYPVNHRTPHMQRWGGWYVTSNAAPAPYTQLGHLGNLTTLGPSVLSNQVMVDWLNSAPETRGYPSSASDLASLLVFDHQMHAMNLLTRLNWESRAAAPGSVTPPGIALRDRVYELVDYLLFVDEAPHVAEVSPRPGFAARLAEVAPKDRRGRSLGQLELKKQLLRYRCSYMIYSDAFDALPPAVKDAVYRRLFDILSKKDSGKKYATLSIADRRAIVAILRDTKHDLPADLRS